MATTKLHMHSQLAEAGMPADVKSDFWKLGLRGALCGFMRKTTADKSEVTCFYCTRQLAREGHVHE